MLNLLNRENRYAIRKEYMFRVFNSFLMASIFLAISFLIVKISVFNYVKSEHQIIKDQKEKIENALISSEQAEYDKKLDHLEREYKLFNSFKNKPSEHFGLVLNNRIDGININEIQIDYTNEKTEIKIGGLAKNRNTLLAFSEKLKTVEKFENVNVPFSSFVKDIDVPFLINVKVKLENNE